jgi:hypothetical protein
MIISTAFPKVALSKPPTASPVRRAISSVAFPIKKARGAMAIIEKKKAISNE